MGKINPRGISNILFFFRAIHVVAVAIFGSIWLTTIGLVGGEFIIVTYPAAIKFTVFCIVVLLVLGPVVDFLFLTKKRQGRTVPAVLLGLMVVLVLPLNSTTLVEVWLGWMTDWGFAQALWAVKILGFVSIILNGWLVWRIWSLGDKDPQVAAREASVERLTAASDAADAPLATADSALTQAQLFKAQAKTAVANAEDLVKKRDKAEVSRQEKFDATHKAAIELKKTAIQDANGVLKHHQKLLENFEKTAAAVTQKASDPTAYGAVKKPLDDNVLNADSALRSAKLALKRAERVALWSLEGRKLTKAKKDAEAAHKALDDAQTSFTGAKNAEATADATFKAAEKVKSKAQKQLDGASEGLTKERLRASQIGRHWWLITILLALATVVSATSWVGWVAVEYA